MIAELKCINMGPSRYDSREATSLRAAVNRREQQLYQEYLVKLRLKDRVLLHTPDVRAAVNRREQQLYQEYLVKLRLKDRVLLHTPDGE